MADRYFNQFQGTLEKGVVKLYAKIEFAGGTNDPDNTDMGKGIVSCAYHGATGRFLLTLKDSYRKVLALTGAMYKHDAVPTASQFSLSHDDVSSAKTFDFYALSGVTGVNPGDGEIAYLEITLSNSSAL